MTAEIKVTLGKTLSPSDPQELKLPHERDESVQAGEVKVDEHAKKAATDASKGIPDTSRAVEANIAYQRQKRP
jgi:hypothetical protein